MCCFSSSAKNFSVHWSPRQLLIGGAGGGTADFEFRETFFEMLCRDAEHLPEFLGGSLPVALVGGIVAVQIGFVPDFPIGDFHVEPVCPGAGAVSDDMFADDRKLPEIRGDAGEPFSRIVFNAAAETEKRFGSGTFDGFQVKVRHDEIITCRIGRVGVEILEDRADVDGMRRAVCAAEICVMQPGVWNAQHFECVEIPAGLIVLWDFGTVVACVHRFDSAKLSSEIHGDSGERFICHDETSLVK